MAFNQDSVSATHLAVVETDDKAIAHLNSGDFNHPSVEEWMSLFLPIARRIVERHNPLPAEFDTDDFVQEFWRKFFVFVESKRFKWNDRRHLNAFCIKMLRWDMRDAYRHHMKGGKGPRTEVPLDLATGISAPGPDMHQILRVDEALSRLSEDDSRILELHFFAGYNANEVAAILGLNTPEAARVRWHRALNKLWTQLGS